ncbi:MAG: IS66 family insertion sequence element accessory protein TnpA [Longimicrobiales bacterium]
MSDSEARAVRRGASFFREVLAELPASGLTLKALASSKGIKPATLYAWSRRLRAEDDPRVPKRERVEPTIAAEHAALRPVRIVAAPARESRAGVAEPIGIIVRGDVEVRVPADLCAESLVRLVAALRGRC